MKSETITDFSWVTLTESYLSPPLFLKDEIVFAVLSADLSSDYFYPAPWRRVNGLMRFYHPLKTTNKIFYESGVVINTENYSSGEGLRCKQFGFEGIDLQSRIFVDWEVCAKSFEFVVSDASKL